MKRGYLFTTNPVITIAVVLCVVLVVLPPLLLESKLKDIAISQSKTLWQDDLSFEEIDVSYLSSFPHLRVSFEGISLRKYQGSSLVAQAKSLLFDISMFRLFSGQEQAIENISLDSPVVYLTPKKHISPAPKAASKPATSEPILSDTSSHPSTPKPTLFAPLNNPLLKQLSSIHIVDGTVHFTPQDGKKPIEIKDINLFIDLASDQDTLNIHLIKSGAYVPSYPDLSLLVYSISSDLRFYYSTQRLEISDMSIGLNSFFVDIVGYVQPKDHETTAVNLKFSELSSRLHPLFDGLKIYFPQELQPYQAEGDMTLRGAIQGNWSASQSPALSLHFDMSKTKLSHRTSKKELTNLSLSLDICKPANRPLDSLAINLNAELDKQNASLKLFAKPFTPKPYINLALNTNLNISTLQPLFSSKEWMLYGQLHTDIQLLDTAYTKGENPEQFRGFISLNNVKLHFPSDHMYIPKAYIKLSPQSAQINHLELKHIQSDVQISGQLEHYFHYLFADKRLYGALNISSNVLRLADLKMKFDEPNTAAPSQPELSSGSSSKLTTATASKASAPPHLLDLPQNANLTLNLEAKELQTKAHTLKNVKSKVTLNTPQLRFNPLSFDLYGGHITTRGKLTNAEQSTHSKVKIQFTNMDISQLLAKEHKSKKYTHIATKIKGKLSGKFDIDAHHDAAFTMDKSTLNSSGTLSASPLKLEGLKVIQTINNKFNARLSDNLKVSTLNLSYTTKQGQLEVKTNRFNLGQVQSNIFGQYDMVGDSLAMALSGRWTSSQIKSNLIQELLNSAGVGNSIDFDIQITKSLDNPNYAIKLKPKKSKKTVPLKKLLQSKEAKKLGKKVEQTLKDLFKF